jgi:deazaflavin-dependent oxidoreductase (nitroreductase family)
MMTIDLATLAAADFCYLTTTGRLTGHSHTVELWFAIHGQTLYILSGGRDRSDWVKNAVRQPEVKIRIDQTTFTAHARLTRDAKEDALARKLLFDKYNAPDEDLDEWARRSLPMAFDLTFP